MYEIHVTERVQADRERVFDAVADHERFFRGSAFEYCRVTVEGEEDRNGLGAFRTLLSQARAELERPEEAV
jgi:hypothetical protein